MTAYESRVRRLARKAGLSLLKSRCRVAESPSFGGYMLTDPYSNRVVAGAYPFEFSLALEDAEAWLSAP